MVRESGDTQNAGSYFLDYDPLNTLMGAMLCEASTVSRHPAAESW
ncbi:MAG TPA: hypothetical protein PK955_00205 [Methanoregulaceae archaeon]|nr:hypothetical protein [Methanoregulaceae archaeon]